LLRLAVEKKKDIFKGRGAQFKETRRQALQDMCNTLYALTKIKRDPERLLKKLQNLHDSGLSERALH